MRTYRITTDEPIEYEWGVRPTPEMRRIMGWGDIEWCADEHDARQLAADGADLIRREILHAPVEDVT